MAYKGLKIFMKKIFLIIFYFHLFNTYLPGEGGLKEISFLSKIDNSIQPAMFYAVDTSEARPLLVGLHTWSGDYRQETGNELYDFCVERNWNFIFPNLRGPNNNPESTGSEYVISDAEDVLKYAAENSNVDTDRIYLIGASGGGYTALLLASKLPGIWAGVSAWVPITDLYQWLIETENTYPKYFNDIINSCGGDPRNDSLALTECIKRSPVTHLENAVNVSIDLNSGIHDGHTGAVPVSHSLNAFNILAADSDTLTSNQIEFITENEMIPEELKFNFLDADYGENKVLFRRKSRNVRVTIFEGTHQMIASAGINWLSQQSKNVVSVQENFSEPEYFLYQNYPNPFNPNTIIKYSIREEGIVHLKIYDILGNEVKTLVNEIKKPGIYEAEFNADQLSSGVYFYRLSANSFTESRKLILLK